MENFLIMKKILLVLVFGTAGFAVHAQKSSEQDIVSVRQERISRKNLEQKQLAIRGYVYILQLNKKDYTDSRNSLLGRCGKSPVLQPENSAVMILIAYPYTKRDIRRAARCKYKKKEKVGIFAKQVSGQYAGKWIQMDLHLEKMPRKENQTVTID